MQATKRLTDRPRIEINSTTKPFPKVASESKIPRPPPLDKQPSLSPNLKRNLTAKFNSRFSKTA